MTKTMKKSAKTGKTAKSAKKFAMCIPCHSEDLNCIDRCFKSIKEQEERIITLEENQKYLDNKIQDLYIELWEKIPH